MMKVGLQEYRQKWGFAAAPEPAGGQKHSEGRPIVVIQKHAARTLHYDLRLDVAGLLKSWTIRKGAAIEPGEQQVIDNGAISIVDSRHGQNHSQPVCHEGFQM